MNLRKITLRMAKSQLIHAASLLQKGLVSCVVQLSAFRLRRLASSGWEMRTFLKVKDMRRGARGSRPPCMGSALRWGM